MKKNKQTTKGVEMLRKRLDAIARASCGTMGKPELAARLGVTVSTIDHWLKQRRRPTLEQAVGLKKLYGIPEDSWARARG